MSIKKFFIVFFICIALVILLTAISLFITSGNYLLTVNPRAMDFLAFYTGAKLFFHSPELLYNLPSQLVLQQDIAPITKTLPIFNPYLNPPFVVLLFLPLAGLSSLLAYDLWLICNAGFVLVLCYLIFLQTRKQSLLSRALFLLGVITFIPVLTSLIIGQLSILLCFIIFCSWLLLQKKKLFLSGLCFSLFLIKPHLLLVPLLAFILQGQKKFLAGLFSGILLWVLISFLLVGWNGLNSYVSLILNASSWNTNYGIDIMAQHSLQTVLLILFNTVTVAEIRPLWYFLNLLLILPTLFVWRKVYPPTSSQTAFQWTLLIIATLLTSPHTHFHDLTLLIVVGYLLFTKLKNFKVILFIGYAIALFGYIFDVASNISKIWIVTDVAYLLLLWFVILHKLQTKTEK